MMKTEVISFRFHEALDAAFLNEIFADDLGYAATVFEDVLDELPQSWSELETAYHRNDMASLKAAAHKCKTLYAYVGMISLRQRMQDIETACDATAAVNINWEQLVLEVAAANMLITHETTRLQEFYAS